MKRIVVVVAVAALALVAPSVVAVPSPAAAATQDRPAAAVPFRGGRYIVTFADDPVASYDGYAPGYPATRPAPGRKLEVGSPAAQRWQQRLVAEHDTALADIGATKIYDYTITNNAVAVELSAAQASRLARRAGVVALHEDERAQPTTTTSPELLGLDAPGGLWSQLGGDRNAGAGVVVGVIDTGIWPESRSFAGGTGIAVPADWRGTCVAGEQFTKRTCNDKLIGARYYLSGFGRKFVSLEDYLSPRDGSGHGTHTASTAAGNVVDGVTVDGRVIDDGEVAGMAPGAKIAAYKVCWEGRPGVAAGCFNSDSVAAINDAVADGVDVINYSIGGSSESDVLDPVEQAFRAASNAGVFVAASAGNSGPGASTFDHPSPWVTTVAAATHRRAFLAAQLGDGSRFIGASNTATLKTPTQLVTSLSVKLATASDDDAALCVPGSLDPAKAAGKVVQCDRGVVDRIAKSFEVQRAGGAGMIMTNTSPNSLNGDLHPIPSVHLSHEARQPILDYIASAGSAATVTIEPLTAEELAAAPLVPEIAEFSSRGPSVTTDGDLLKPDIAAPGVDVLAAVAPPFHFGRDWDMVSGTSMASPHVAGIGALVRALHPDWLASEIKSALMTTATDTVSSAADPFAQGAGFVQPNPAADPGLVYPTTADEYRQFMVSLGVQFAPPFDTLAPVEASNLNLPSISIGKLAGTETVTRRVRNVSDAAATYTASVDLPGFAVVVSPAAFTLEPGGQAEFTVQITRTDAPLGEWVSGALNWTSEGGKAVRSPIAVEAVTVSAPSEVEAPISDTGSVDLDVIAGFAGALDPTLHGLVGVEPISDSVTTGTFDINAPTPDADTKHYTVDVGEGAFAARFSLDSLDDTADLDLFVYKDGQFVDLSASGAADEEVTLLDPQPGTYDVYVNGFATPGGTTSYGLANFVLPPGDLDNSGIAPDEAAVQVGEPVTFTASWSDLDVTKRWLGVITYAGTPTGGGTVEADTVTLLAVG